MTSALISINFLILQLKNWQMFKINLDIWWTTTTTLRHWHKLSLLFICKEEEEEGIK